MEKDIQEILDVIERYKTAVHTQKKEDFFPIWAESCQTSLISLATCYSGTESIYQNFIIGAIQKAYTSIELITEDANVRVISPDCAMAIFSYRTVCTRRETGEPYGIAGLETQIFKKESGVWKLVHVHYAVDKSR